MSVTSGFFNSLNGDRKYNAEQMSSLFNGIINDGVFQNIGAAFAVTVNSKNIVNVNTGRAWFNSTWINNDAILPLTFEDSEVLVDRIDAIVFDIDHTDLVRAGSIMIVKGVGSETPANPTLVSEELHHQYPIAYVYRKANSTEILQENITIKVGTSECPFITGILKTVSIDNLLAQWKDQFTQWSKGEQDSYMSWFKNLQYVLDGDVAGHLQNEINNISDNLTYVTNEEVDELFDGTSSGGSEADLPDDAAVMTADDLTDTINAIYDGG